MGKGVTPIKLTLTFQGLVAGWKLKLTICHKKD